MYGLYKIALLLSAAVCTNAATALFPVEEKPAEFSDREGCYLKHLNKVIPYGDYHPENSCTQYSCYTSNITQVFTCVAQQVDENSPCRLVSGDASRNYPDCCPSVMCSTNPSEATTEDTAASVIEQTTQVLEADATSEAKSHANEAPLYVLLVAHTIPSDYITSEDTTSVVEPTTQALDSEATREVKSLDEGPAELLVAEASVNQ